MNTVTVYACPSVPMDSIECTIEYDPAVVEAFLHPPNSGQERADDGSFEMCIRDRTYTVPGLCKIGADHIICGLPVYLPTAKCDKIIEAPPQDGS